jgi:hypothetical protein
MNPAVTLETLAAPVNTLRSPARVRVVAYVTCMLFAIAWTLYAGKDVPWDALHYHLYAGFSAFNDRTAIDFYPAGGQTYLNPYAHAPLYLMVRAGWPSLAIGIALACLHSAMLWLTWELARAVSRRTDGTSPAAVTWSAVALAALNPVLLQELGSSFTDITTGALALGGYVALANAFAAARPVRLVGLGGALLGAAAALKLSNAVLALVPALPLVLGWATTGRLRVRALLVFGGCAGVVALAFSGPWAWQLERAFGNPFYPMLNDVFRPTDLVTTTAGAASAAPASPVAAALRVFNSMRDPRFLPSSLAEALVRPFEMLRPRRLIHTETMAADARYAGLLLLSALALVALVWRRWRGVAATETSSGRPLACLVASFVIAWLLWLGISGNSRYFLPMACIAAVILVAGLRRVLAGLPRAQGYALVVVLSLQGLLLATAAEFRWSPQHWGGPWVQPAVPSRLQTEPNLYLPIDSQSQSFLLPSLAPGSAFMGLNDIAPDGRDGQRARALLDGNASRLRMLKLVQAIESDGRPVAPAPAAFDFPLRRLGLRVDTGDCDYISYKGNPDVIERSGPRSGPRDRVYLYTCRVLPGPGLTEAELARKRVVDSVLDRVEDACPEFFHPRRMASLRSGAIWRRNYPDFVTWVNDEGFVRFADLIRGGGDFVAIGREEEWVRAPQRLSCWRAGGRDHVERVKG